MTPAPAVPKVPGQLESAISTNHYPEIRRNHHDTQRNRQTDLQAPLRAIRGTPPAVRCSADQHHVHGREPGRPNLGSQFTEKLVVPPGTVVGWTIWDYTISYGGVETSPIVITGAPHHVGHDRCQRAGRVQDRSADNLQSPVPGVRQARQTKSLTTLTFRSQRPPRQLAA